mgnify:FL=1
MEELKELVQIFKERAALCAVKAEISSYLEDKHSQELHDQSDEHTLIASLLEDYNQVLEYDEMYMYLNIGRIGFKQITKIEPPLDKAATTIAIFDLAAEEQIDKIKISRALNKEELKAFAESYCEYL